MRREESGGKGVVLAVSTPTSSRHISPEEKKLNAKNFSITIFAAMSSRILKNTGTRPKKEATPEQVGILGGSYQAVPATLVLLCEKRYEFLASHLKEDMSYARLIQQHTPHKHARAPVSPSTRVFARIEAVFDGPLPLRLRFLLRETAHPNQPMVFLLVLVDVATVTRFAGNDRLG